MSRFKHPGKWRPNGPSRTDTGSTIRGKISAPIPIADDDEFPIRTPGTGMAEPLSMEDFEKQSQQRAPSTTGFDNTAQEDTSAEPEPHNQIAPTRSPPVLTRPAPADPVRHANQPSTLRDSVTSTPGIAEGKPQRKKSSLRSVFGRLFGRKLKVSASSSPTGQAAGELRAGQHRSDPTALSRSARGAAIIQQRSASLPINEFDRALRSHSIATEDFPLQSNTGEVYHGSILDVERTRPRRATTPSRLWTPNKIPGALDWTGLSPRPASSHARGSKVNHEEDAVAAIGTAVTSGSNPNRRSRSVGEIREGAPVQIRRRSDEIRYWRASYDAILLSPLSSNKAEVEEPILMDDVEDAHDAPPLEQPQPFNFGPLGAMAGMKISEAASLETRVISLESRILELEKKMTQTVHRTSTDTIVLQEPPKRSSKRDLKRDRSSSLTRPTTDISDVTLATHQRHQDVAQTKTTIESRPPGNQERSSSYGTRYTTDSTAKPSHPAFESPSLTTFLNFDEQSPVSASQETARPISTTTAIRALPPGSPSAPRDGNLTAEHYTALLNMIVAEQAARQRLEALVSDLQQQLHALRSSPPAAYPSSKLSSPSAVGGGVVPGGEFSTFEQDDSSDDEGRYGNAESLQTPSDDRGRFEEEVFGNIPHSEGEAKGEARTLSLSQMTLGTGQQSRGF